MAKVRNKKFEKVDFIVKNITTYNEDHFKMIKGSIHQQDIIILNIYTPNNRFPKYTKQ